eukprot:snap_masked-scaffold_5-processed-gene-5.36-mRNA-1 protein AED:1.00 eAED:1.00 QI:0/0/0/0/1/1/4/0/86
MKQDRKTKGKEVLMTIGQFGLCSLILKPIVNLGEGYSGSGSFQVKRSNISSQIAHNMILRCKLEGTKQIQKVRFYAKVGSLAQLQV